MGKIGEYVHETWWKTLQNFQKTYFNSSGYFKRETSNLKDTYNLDAVSPRMTNKKSSHMICGEVEESNNLMDRCFLNTHSESYSLSHSNKHERRWAWLCLTTVILLFLICNGGYTQRLKLLPLPVWLFDLLCGKTGISRKFTHFQDNLLFKLFECKAKQREERIQKFDHFQFPHSNDSFLKKIIWCWCAEF